MRPSLRLGRVAGIPVGLHWSVLGIVFLVCDALATAILPSSVKGASVAAYWAVGVLTGVGFFAGLLLHEVAHALVARRHGMHVNGITLWMLGGVTQMDGQPPNAQADFRVAVAGPATSVVVAGLAALFAGTTELLAAPRLLTAGLWWLAITNGFLAVFNLLPGAPLDGGRVLRAWIWRRTGNRDHAAATAARVGRATGVGFVALGILQSLAAGDLLAGLWFVLIGWFLMAAATAEMQDAFNDSALHGVTVAEVMQTDVLVLPGYQAVSVAAQRAVMAGVEVCPVCDIDGAPIGLVHVDRLVRAATSGEPDVRVAQLAAPVRPQALARPDELASVAIARAGVLSVLIVVSDGRIVGVVTPLDIARARRRKLLDVQPELAAAS